MDFLSKVLFLEPDFLHLILAKIKDGMRSWLSENKAFYMINFSRLAMKYKTKDGKMDPNRLSVDELVDGFRTALHSVIIHNRIEFR